MDKEIKQLRFNISSDFHTDVDDYLQYSPAVLILGLKAFGYDGRSSWGELGTSAVFSYALMFASTQGLKYAVDRTRPDADNHSFPSGHTATAFLFATMLHKEYSCRSPYWSIGGYWLSTLIAYSRLMNNRHWLTDVATGAALGIGSAHLGFFLSDLIFKKKVEREKIVIDKYRKYYEISTYVTQRFILGHSTEDLSGSTVGLETKIPLVPNAGIIGRFAVNSLTSNDEPIISSNAYNAIVGAFHSWNFLRILETDLHALAGYTFKAAEGFDLSAGASFGVCMTENLRLRIIGDYELMRVTHGNYLNSLSFGLSFATVW